MKMAGKFGSDLSAGVVPPSSGFESGDLCDEEKSSFQKKIGNAMNLINDGLYRIKNRNKSELVSQQSRIVFNAN